VPGQNGGVGMSKRGTQKNQTRGGGKVYKRQQGRQGTVDRNPGKEGKGESEPSSGAPLVINSRRSLYMEGKFEKRKKKKGHHGGSLTPWRAVIAAIVKGGKVSLYPLVGNPRGKGETSGKTRTIGEGTEKKSLGEKNSVKMTSKKNEGLLGGTKG